LSGDKGERRGHFRGKPRPGRRVQVRYQALGGEEIAAHTKNIGIGGAFIVTSSPPKVGTQLRLLIEVPSGSDAIEVRAEVRWHAAENAQERGMGVRFAGLDVDQLLALSEYFASLTATVDHD
jgi:uncharacterized protein (TIGR02266 family)